MKKEKKHDNHVYIFRASITKDGRTIYARDYGLKAFKIRIDK